MGDDVDAWTGGPVTLAAVSGGWMRGVEPMDDRSEAGSVVDLENNHAPYSGVEDMVTKVLGVAGMEVESGSRWQSMESTAYAESSDVIDRMLRDAKCPKAFAWPSDRPGSIVATLLVGAVTIRSIAKRRSAVYESSLPSGAHTEVSTNQGYWYKFRTSCFKDAVDEEGGHKVMGTTVGMCSALLLAVRYGDDGEQEEVCISGVMNNGHMTSVMALMAWSKGTSTKVALPSEDTFDASHRLCDFESIHGEGRAISIDDLAIMDGLIAALGDKAEEQRLFSVFSANTKQAQWDMKSIKLAEQVASVQAWTADLSELLSPEYCNLAIKIHYNEERKPLCWDKLADSNHFVGMDHLIRVLLRNRYHHVQDLDLFGGVAVYADQLGQDNLSVACDPHELLDKTIAIQDARSRVRAESVKVPTRNWTVPRLSRNPTYAELQALKMRIRQSELTAASVNQFRSANLAGWLFSDGQFDMSEGQEAEGWGIFQKSAKAYDTLKGKKQQTEVQGPKSGYFKKADLDAYESVVAPLVGRGKLLDTIDTFIDAAVEEATKKTSGCQFDLDLILSFQKLKNEFRTPPYPEGFNWQPLQPNADGGQKRRRAGEKKNVGAVESSSDDSEDEDEAPKITESEVAKLRSKIATLTATRKELTGKVTLLQAEVVELKAKAPITASMVATPSTPEIEFNKFVFAMASRCVEEEQWDEFMELHMPLLSHSMPSINAEHAQVEELKAIMKKKWDYQTKHKQKK